MSFVNPGDVTPGGGRCPTRARSFDCGANGECLAVNMTPTCVCDHGFVAVGSFGTDGTRATRCEQPMMAVPDEFYASACRTCRRTARRTRDGGGRSDAAGDRAEHRRHRSDGHAGAARRRREPSGEGAAGNQGEGPGGPASSNLVMAQDSGPCAVSAPGARRGTGLGALLLLGLLWLQRRR